MIIGKMGWLSQSDVIEGGPAKVTSLRGTGKSDRTEDPSWHLGPTAFLNHVFGFSLGPIKGQWESIICL